MFPVSTLSVGTAATHLITSCSSFAAGTELRQLIGMRRADPGTPLLAGTVTIHVAKPKRDGIATRCSTIQAPDDQMRLQQHGQAAADRLGKLEPPMTVRLVIHKAPTYTWPPHRLDVRLVSSTNINPETGEGVQSLSAAVYIPPGEETMTLTVPITALYPFGTPGAVLLNSQHRDEFFLESISLESHDGRTHIDMRCNSWVTETEAHAPRIFFSNQVYLPAATPPGLAQLRQTELQHLRGDGTGRRIAGERIYDYDVYNDLGDPDHDEASARPVLGASQTLPYPRRCRTGREQTATDPKSEAPEPGYVPFYVPRDEQFSATKQKAFDEKLHQSQHTVASHARAYLYSAPEQIPTFGSFEDIFNLYDGSGNFPLPPIIQADTVAWMSDEEFGRQRLAGLNPLVIERLKVFPIVSSLDPQIYGPPTSAITAQHIEHQLENLTVDQAISQKRLFVLDYHDALLPYLNKVNESQVKVYASRTLFFVTHDGIMRPIAIELSLPPAQEGNQRVNRVFTPPPLGGIDNLPGGKADRDETLGWLWQLARAQVAINDTGYHQLISHWLRTHACVEPFVIATHRHLSVLHPLHRLLYPHFKDTMSINGLARKHLISSGGVIESTFFPGEFCMELSSVVYRTWRFDEQALPNDLIKRGMAEVDAENRLVLAVHDYPYAVDGLDLWTALQSWVHDYIAIYYQNDKAVRDDSELQSWWTEIREKGHGDHNQDDWWGCMETISKLEETLVTLIWIASGHHAAVNFGQYAYAGFMPNNPTMGKRSIPEDNNSQEYEDLRDNPERFYLSSLSTYLEAVTVMGTLLLLSQHIEEEFVGERADGKWTSDPRVLVAFDKFNQKLKQVEQNIQARNQDHNKYRNRYGPAQIPYTLLFPSSDQGMTYQGVPNSISI